MEDLIKKFLLVDDSGYGSGDGNGDGLKLTTLNSKSVHYIDAIPCTFISIKGNIAKVEVIQDDFSFKPAFVYKHINVFAHGNTIKEAKADAENKYYSQMNVENKLKQLRKMFSKSIKLKARILFDWHGILTGSCRFGREAFVTGNNISLEKEYTIEEFVAITQHSYGGEIVKKLIDI